VPGAGGLDGFYYNPSGYAGVTFSGTSEHYGNGGSGIADNGSFFGFPNAPDGQTDVAFIQNHYGVIGAITLDLTDLTAGDVYTASFYTAARPGYANNPLTIRFDGATIGSSSGASAGFVEQKVEFTATGTSGDLEFIGGGNRFGDADVALGTVTINSGVPEPAAWALMLIGFGGAGARLRAQRRPLVA
jgi:hypothetical protein